MFDFFENNKKVAKILIEKNLTVSTAESCTGGLISSLLTDVSGSSNFVMSNFVTYSNDAKMKYLDVNETTLNEYGAVSEFTAKEMAEGLLKQANTNIAVSITGIAGPTGGSKQKPVGLAYVGVANQNKTIVEKIQFNSLIPRKLMKYCFAQKALSILYTYLKDNYGEKNERT